MWFELVAMTRRADDGSARGHAGQGLYPALAMYAVCCFSVRTQAVEFPLAAGEYAIRSNMLMPHLEEMRRITAQETRCIGQDAPLALFPVMRQPALRGCTFGYGEARGASFQYVLVCQMARVATGTVELTQGATVTGNLVVKMGGKNMTFSQRVEAERQGECSPATEQ